MAKKYLKNSEGIVRAVTSDNLGLEKPLANENYDIDVHNRNMDKIDSAIIEDKSNISSLQSEVATNKTNISSLQTKVNNGQNHKLTNENGTGIQISESDLNELKKCGNYYGWGLKNAPSNTAIWFYVEVFVRDYNYIYQRLTALNDSNMSKYERTCRNGTWEDWRTLAGQNLKLTNNEGQIDVSSAGNFNNLVKTGWYYITSPTNSPVTGGAWYLEVMSRDGGYVYQRATRNESGNNNLAKYERTMHNNTWTAWREL